MLKIDCILALDDEALILAKKLMLHQNSFMHLKSVVFAGVNNYVYLSNKKQKYIKGIFGYQDNSQLIDIIPEINVML